MFPLYSYLTFNLTPNKIKILKEVIKNILLATIKLSQRHETYEKIIKLSYLTPKHDDVSCVTLNENFTPF